MCIRDRLWVKYSGGKFGFSVQKQIYQDLGGTKDYDEKVWESFGDKVGWRKGGSWLSYSNLTFSEGYYMGHLPVFYLRFYFIFYLVMGWYLHLPVFYLDQRPYRSFFFTLSFVFFLNEQELLGRGLLILSRRDL